MPHDMTVRYRARDVAEGMLLKPQSIHVLRSCCVKRRVVKLGSSDSSSPRD